MASETCEVCGYKSRLGVVKKRPTIPDEIAKLVDIPDSRNMRICLNCYGELESWYSAKIVKMVYDTSKQQFRDKTSTEMVTEYRLAFHAFVNYKRDEIKMV